MKPIRILSLSTTGFAALGLIMACSSEPDPTPNNTSGGATSGGATSGGATSGGATSGGASSGGASSGGASSGGSSSGGSSSGGAATGGSGGAAKGGSSSGGASAGSSSGGASAGSSSGGASAGSSSGGAATGGSGGGSAGAATGGSGGGGTFSPVCGKNSAGVDIKKDTECKAEDPQLCYRTCGVEAKGFKPETCTAGKYAEGACQFPAGDYACYKLPAAAGAGCPTDAATAPQHNQACTVAACTVCGGTSAGQTTGYKDSGGAAKVGYCVCAGSKWQCASDKEWPCPAGTGCQ